MQPWLGLTELLPSAGRDGAGAVHEGASPAPCSHGQELEKANSGVLVSLTLALALSLLSHSSLHASIPSLGSWFVAGTRS